MYVVLVSRRFLRYVIAYIREIIEHFGLISSSFSVLGVLNGCGRALCAKVCKLQHVSPGQEEHKVAWWEAKL